MPHVLLLNKPYGVLCQFTAADDTPTLSSLLRGPEFSGYYPAGRLDLDSEGLMVLTDNGQVQSRIAHPKHKLPKTYWVQVEGSVTKEALQILRDGVTLKDGPTAPAKVNEIPPPAIWPRDPPVRFRRHIPTSWLEITLTEGRNRQVRRMTAAAGLPTLRLVRQRIGSWSLNTLQPGEWRWATLHLPKTSPRQKPSARKTRTRGSL